MDVAGTRVAARLRQQSRDETIRMEDDVFHTLRTKTAALVVSAIAAGTLLLAAGDPSPARAVTPAQSTHAGLVSLLGWDLRSGTVYQGSLEAFWRQTLPAWGARYHAPHGLHLYGGRHGQYQVPGCRSTAEIGPSNGFYCPRTQRIYLDTQRPAGWNFGDYGAGGFLAHEWGHRVQHLLGDAYLQRMPHREYHADCLAGIYTRWAYGQGRLQGTDYGEFQSWLQSTPRSDSHGLPSYRAAWYRHGYTQFSLQACNEVYRARTRTRAAGPEQRHVAPPSTVGVTPAASQDGLPAGAGAGTVPSPGPADHEPHGPIR